MKRISSIFLALVLVCVLVGTAFAAWSITQSRSHFKTTYNEWMIITLSCTSDAGATDTALTYDVTGYSLYAVETDPGDASPDAVYTLDIEDADNFHLLDLDDRSRTAKEIASGSTTLGIFPSITSTPSVVMSTLGNANTTTVTIHFVR